MALTITACRSQFTGNGSTTVFATSFPFLDNSYVSVISTDTSGNNTTLVLGTDYTLSGVGNPSGGTVTCTTAPASGTTLTILRITALNQQTTFVDNDALPAATLENGLDKLTMMIQEQLSPGGSVDRSIKFSSTEPSGFNAIIPNIKARLGKLIGFDPTTGALSLFSSVPAQFFAGSSVPASGLGSNGDWYMRFTTGDIYGPKSGGSWGSPVANFIGPTGATGATGATGPASAWGTIPGTLSNQTDLQAALNAKVPTTRQVVGGTSLAGGGALSADQTLTLANDSASPGNNQVYGTNSSGTKGWKADPSSGRANAVLLTSSGTWTVPAGVTTCRAVIIGGGGGGGGTNGSASGSAGGGSGAVIVGYFSGLTPSGSISYTIGAAGSAGSAGSGSAAGTGGTTTFNGVAAGGGTGAATTTAGGGASAPSSSQTPTTGSIGANSLYLAGISGDGGGASRSGARGGPTPLGYGAGGAGYYVSTGSVAGGAGTGYGAGGGGGCRNGSDGAGGAGAQGMILIEY